MKENSDVFDRTGEFRSRSHIVFYITSQIFENAPKNLDILKNFREKMFKRLMRNPNNFQKMIPETIGSFSCIPAQLGILVFSERIPREIKYYRTSPEIFIERTTNRMPNDCLAENNRAASPGAGSPSAK